MKHLWVLSLISVLVSPAQHKDWLHWEEAGLSFLKASCLSTQA